MRRIHQIGIIGPNRAGCSEALYDFGVQLGNQIAHPNRIFICGGAAGFMEAVCKGVKQSVNTFNGQTVGILMDEHANHANPFVDIAISTGMGIGRNLLIIQSSDWIIAAGGGAGTLSELAFAWQKKKKVFCITTFGGWAAELADKRLDERAEGLLIPVPSIEAIQKHLEFELKSYSSVISS